MTRKGLTRPLAPVHRLVPTLRGHFGRCQIDWLADAIRAELLAGTLSQRATLRMLATSDPWRILTVFRQDSLRDSSASISTLRNTRRTPSSDGRQPGTGAKGRADDGRAGGRGPGTATANQSLRRLRRRGRDDGRSSAAAVPRRTDWGRSPRQQRAGPPDGETEADPGRSPALLTQFDSLNDMPPGSVSGRPAGAGSSSMHWIRAHVLACQRVGNRALTNR